MEVWPEIENVIWAQLRWSRPRGTVVYDFRINRTSIWCSRSEEQGYIFITVLKLLGLPQTRRSFHFLKNCGNIYLKISGIPPEPYDHEKELFQDLEK